MSEEIKYTLNVQSVINPLAKEKGETNFVLVSNGTADFDRVISEMMAVNPGLERETIEMVVKLEHRTIQRLTLNGMRVRFRSVMMTALSFVIGVFPMVVASGAGAGSRQSIGVTTFWGMLVATVLGMMFIPGLYVIFRSLAEAVSGFFRRHW